MFIYESFSLFFFLFFLLTAGTMCLRYVGTPIQPVQIYLFVMILTTLVNPFLYYFYNYIQIEDSMYAMNPSDLDLFFAGDFLFLLLFGGVIATRSIIILKKHFYLSITSTIFITISLLIFDLNQPDSIRHIVISLSLIVLLTCINIESVKSLSKLTYGRSFLLPNCFISFVSICLWLTMFFLIISFDSIDEIPYSMTQSILNFWLILKSFFLFLCLYFIDFIEEEEKQLFSVELIKNANNRTEQMSLACISLFKLPYPVFVISLEGNIEFSNAESMKILGIGDLDGKNINSMFLTIEPSSSTTSLASIQLADRSLRMFKIKFYSFDLNKSVKKVCCIERVDFNFTEFCNGIISKGNNTTSKILGILDHNFAIYRMSSQWTELLNPIDKFFHSGLIWDKLKILSKDQHEIVHLENSVAASSESLAWLNLRSGRSIKIKILKLYAPDFAHFYLFSADIVDEKLDPKKIHNYVTSHQYKTT